MITSDKVFKLVAKFESVAHLARHKDSLDMIQTKVEDTNKSHICGTVHCHAGWYAVACRDERRYKIVLHYKKRISYRSGVCFMTKDLGFEGDTLLSDWMEDNPEIWGNNDGGFVFTKASAFNFTGDKLTFQDIINHWGDVGMRLLTEELYKEGNLE